MFAYFGYAGSSLLSAAFSGCGKQGLPSSWNVLTSPFDNIPHCRAWDQGVGVSGLVRCSVVMVRGFRWYIVCGVFLDRDPTCIPGADQWILNHRTTREVPFHDFLWKEARVCAYWSPVYDMHLNSLKTPACFPLLEFPSGHTVLGKLQWITAFSATSFVYWNDKWNIYPQAKASEKTGSRTELLFSCSVVSLSLWPQGMQHARLPCPSSSPTVCSNSCPLSWWCHPTISSFVNPFSSCPQSFPGSGFCFE